MKVYRIYSLDEANEIVEKLESIGWSQGKASNAHATGTVKQNKEILHSDHPVAQEILADMHHRLTHCELVNDFFVDQIIVPKFNRYDAGDAYYSHADAGLMGGVFRTDLACTVFLNTGFKGGELCANDCSILGDPGQAVVYECWRPHYVNPVLQGSRIAAITWIKSLFRDYQQIEMMSILRSVLKEIDRQGEEERLYPRISAVYGKLTKMWVS